MKENMYFKEKCEFSFRKDIFLLRKKYFQTTKVVKYSGKSAYLM